MLDLQRWSPVRVAVSGLLSIILVVVLFVGYAALQLFNATRTAEGTGIGAASVGINVNGWLMIAVLFGPPLVRTAFWIMKRRSAGQQAG
jgi:hypothetical protein